jgi:hypothetical protein
MQVLEDEVNPGAVCTRRNYARWLIATSSTLTRLIVILCSVLQSPNLLALEL